MQIDSYIILCRMTEDHLPRKVMKIGQGSFSLPLDKGTYLRRNCLNILHTYLVCDLFEGVFGSLMAVFGWFLKKLI